MSYFDPFNFREVFPVGPDGNRITKTKYTHPYSYDPFVIWSSGKKATDSVYTDRLSQWDHDKTRELCKKHMPLKRWDNAEPKQIEAFLREYWDNDKVELCRVSEYCNVSSGYPCWRLDYREGK